MIGWASRTAGFRLIAGGQPLGCDNLILTNMVDNDWRVNVENQTLSRPNVNKLILLINPIIGMQIAASVNANPGKPASVSNSKGACGAL